MPLVGINVDVQASTTDAVGNILLAGEFSGSLTAGSTTLTSAGGYDAFVAKWSPTTGNYVWAQRLGGAGADVARSITVSGSNVYVGGDFSLTASFGASSLTSAGRSDGFVAKLVDGGGSSAVAWAQQLSGTGEDEVFAVAVNGTSVYAGGKFNSASLTAGAQTIASAGADDGFVAKLADLGNAAGTVWAQPFGGSGDDIVHGLAATATGFYAVGAFNATASWLLHANEHGP